MSITPRILPQDYVKAKKLRLKERGIKYPATTVAEARRTGLDLALACALLMQESHGGANIYGHDPVDTAPKGAMVTAANYKTYLHLRGVTGKGGMQGVGPVQLTWWEFQNEADRLGGCWKPWINMRVGFSHLARQVKAYGYSAGCARYNGSGPAANRYASQMMTRYSTWRKIVFNA